MRASCQALIAAGLAVPAVLLAAVVSTGGPASAATPAGTLSAAGGSAVKLGSSITFDYTASSANAANWIAVYPHGRQPGATAPVTWTYSPAGRGTATLSGARLTTGSWDAYLLYDDGIGAMAGPVTFSVTSLPSSLAGSGTAADPYQIASAADLAAVISAVNADTGHTSAAVDDYVLTKNINFGGQTTSGMDYFGGVFNGQGHVISNLKLTTDDSSLYDNVNSGRTGDFLGLFKVADQATLENIGLDDVTATAAQPAGGGSSYAAATLAADAFASTITGNQVVNSTVTGGGDVGGLVGHAYSATFADWTAVWDGGDSHTTVISDNAVEDTTLTGPAGIGGIVDCGQGTVTVSDNYVSAVIHDTAGPSATSTAGEVVGATTSNISGGTGNNLVTSTDNVVGGGSITFASGGARLHYVGKVFGGVDDGNYDDTSSQWSESGDLVSPSMTISSNLTGAAYSSSAGNADGTTSTAAALASQSTYTGLGWDFSGGWNWDSVLNQPTLDAYGVQVSGTDGTASASVPLAFPDQTVTLTGQPASGYVLGGWTVSSPADGSVTVAADGSFIMPAQGVAVAADFAGGSFPVTYDANGGTGSMAGSTVTVGTATSLEANAYTNPGYTFAGWATSPDGAPVYADQQSVTSLVPAPGDSAITLYAAWLPDGDYQVSVTASGNGSAQAPGWYAAPGSVVSLSASPDPGYSVQWQASGVTVRNSAFVMPSADVTLTASFPGNTYTVRFDGNGADGGSTASQTLTYGQATALSADGFARDDEQFAGWSTSPDGSASYADGQQVADLTTTAGGTVTLYAVWIGPQATAGIWPSLPGGFVTGAFQLPAVPEGGHVTQQLLGLWNASATTQVTFTKVSGDSWLNVTFGGVVWGTAPAAQPQNAGTIVVSATDGTSTSQMTITVPVLGTGQAPQIRTSTWNAWDDGTNVTDAVGKNLGIVAAQGINVIGFNSGGGAMAEQVASALGWHFLQTGDLGIVSAFPLLPGDTVTPATATPASAATTSVYGRPVRVWDTALDGSDYGPYNAAFNGVTSPRTLVADEESTTRYAQAQAIVKEMTPDIHSPTPVVLLGDLESPSGTDWTAATASSHDGIGAVDWPVPALFARAGLTDSFRAANRNPVTDPGNTWSPLAQVSVPNADVLNVNFASGSATDQAQGIAPTIEGAPAIGQDSTLGTDVATFNGSTDAYTYPVTIPWTSASGLTFECKFKYNGSSIPTKTYPTPCADADYPTSGSYLQFNGGKLYLGTMVNGTSVGVSAPTAAQAGTWYDVVGTYDGSVIDLYVNGALVASTPVSGSIAAPPSGYEYTIGAYSNGPDGALADEAPVSVAAARIWSTALTSAQVASLSGTYTLPGTPATAAGKAIPQDRIDYVDYSGDLHVDESHALVVGFPTAANVSNQWTSDHAAVVTTFTVGNGYTPVHAPAPAVVVRDNTVAYAVGATAPTAEAFLSQVGARSTPGSTLSVDLSQVNFAAEGWYTAQVTATNDRSGYVSNPVSVAVRIDPGPSLTLQATTAIFNVGQRITQSTALTLLDPQPTGEGTVTVALTGVDRYTPGSYPVTVTATDQWGVQVSASATVVVDDPAVVQVIQEPNGTAKASEDLANPGDTVNLTATPDSGYQLTGWKVISEPTKTAVTVGSDGTFTMPSSGSVVVIPEFAPQASS